MKISINNIIKRANNVIGLIKKAKLKIKKGSGSDSQFKPGNWPKKPSEGKGTYYIQGGDLGLMYGPLTESQAILVADWMNENDEEVNWCVTDKTFREGFGQKPWSDYGWESLDPVTGGLLAKSGTPNSNDVMDRLEISFRNGDEEDEDTEEDSEDMSEDDESLIKKLTH
jgi:hypothetical protein